MNHQNFERILRFRDIPGSMCVSVSAHTPLTPLGGGGGLSKERLLLLPVTRGGGVWALPVRNTHGHPPKSRPACQTTFVPTIATPDLVSLGLVRCGCGKSVTRHHRQRDGSRRMPASILWSFENTVRQTLERGRCAFSTTRSDQAQRITPFLRVTSLGPDAHKRTR